MTTSQGRRRLLLALLAGGAGALFWHWRLGRIVPHPPDYGDDLAFPATFLLGVLWIVLAAPLLSAAPRWALLSGLPFLAWLTLGPSLLEENRLGLYRSGCANHISQGHVMVLNRKLGDDRQLRLPETTDYDAVLTWAGVEDDVYRTGFYCPGRAASPLRSGYVFVGGGLPLHGMERALIAFCADECHAFTPDFQMSMTLDDRRCWSRAELSDRIAVALEAAEKGTIPYSPAAVELLKSELAKRRGSAK